MERFLSIDYGDKNIGLAVSDTSNSIALPLLTITRKDKYTIKPYVSQIGSILKEHNITTIVLGFPKNMDNTLGERAKITLDFKDRLHRNFKKIDIVLWDERLSTNLAERLLREQNIPAVKQKNVIDQLSACIILQDFLGYLSHKTSSA